MSFPVVCILFHQNLFSSRLMNRNRNEGLNVKKCINIAPDDPKILDDECEDPGYMIQEQEQLISTTALTIASSWLLSSAAVTFFSIIICSPSVVIMKWTLSTVSTLWSLNKRQVNVKRAALAVLVRDNIFGCFIFSLKLQLRMWRMFSDTPLK